MLYDIVQDAEQAVREWLEKNAEEVRADRLGLDARAGTVWVSEEAIVAEGWNVRALDYYGGFEYVSKEQRSQVGSLTIYYAQPYEDDCRVQECIERWEDSKGE